MSIELNNNMNICKAYKVSAWLNLRQAVDHYWEDGGNKIRKLFK